MFMGNTGLYLYAENIHSFCSALKMEWSNNALVLEIQLFTSSWIGREKIGEKVLEFALT